MSRTHITKIASELSLKPHQVEAVAELFDGGATIPFIARYRKEVTGSLDEIAITDIRNRLNQLRELDARRESIINSLHEREQLTEELKNRIMQAETMAILEDIYLPYRPKRRTRATIAREKGLETLAELIFAQDPAIDPATKAKAFIDESKGLESAEAVLAGARDIIAEWISQNETARVRIRDLFSRKGCFRTMVVQGKEAEGRKYEDYFDWQEPVATAPSHRILAMRRGAKEGFLRLHVIAPEEQALRILEE
ncbi:MAG: RNA-binding transcriptional accessory protein, partial [Phycisphaerae bacterium]|nr:RNA-binding transcriptional accessory protein [Phycisphaerae bacterium]